VGLFIQLVRFLVIPSLLQLSTLFRPYGTLFIVIYLFLKHIVPNGTCDSCFIKYFSN